MDLCSLSSLTTLMGHPGPVVIGLSSQWYFEGLDCLGLVMGSDHVASERSAAVMEEDFNGLRSFRCGMTPGALDPK